MDMSLNKLQELVTDREAWRAAGVAAIGLQRVGHDWVTEQQQLLMSLSWDFEEKTKGEGDRAVRF